MSSAFTTFHSPSRAYTDHTASAHVTSSRSSSAPSSTNAFVSLWRERPSASLVCGHILLRVGRCRAAVADTVRRIRESAISTPRGPRHFSSRGRSGKSHGQRASHRGTGEDGDDVVDDKDVAEGEGYRARSSPRRHRGGKSKHRSAGEGKAGRRDSTEEPGARRVRLCALVSVLCLLLFSLLLLLLLLVLLIFGPQIYEARAARIRAGGATGIASSALHENFFVAKLFDLFGVGVMTEHQKRLQQQKEVNEASLRQDVAALATMGVTPDIYRKNGRVGPQGMATPGSSAFVNDKLLKDLFKVDLRKNPELLAQRLTGTTSGAFGGGGAGGLTAAQLRKRSSQLRELSLWLQAIDRHGAMQEEDTQTSPERRVISAAAIGDVKRNDERNDIGAIRAYIPRGGRAAVLTDLAALSWTATTTQMVPSLPLRSDTPATMTMSGRGLHTHVSLDHFTRFYTRLRERYSDEMIARLAAAMSGGNGGGTDPGGRDAMRDSEGGANAAAAGSAGERAAVRRARAQREASLGFASAVGTAVREHKRLRPMDELELLKYRHRFMAEEAGVDASFRTALDTAGGEHVDENGGAQRASRQHTTTVEAKEGIGADVDVDFHHRLDRIAAGHHIKRALYTVAPSVLNRQYFFPLQRMELHAPYSMDTVRGTDAWYTPVAAELLFYLDTDPTAAIYGHHEKSETSAAPMAAADTVAASLDPQSVRLPWNHYLQTGDPLLPLSLMQNELKFLSSHRLTTVERHVTSSKQRDKFTNKENMLEHVGNIAPLFESLALNGGAATRNNGNVWRLIRRLRAEASDTERETSGYATTGTAAGAKTTQAERRALMQRLNAFLAAKKRAVSNEKSIFVSMAAFRDVECAPTLTDMFKKALNPKRVYVGIAEQHRPGDPSCLQDVIFAPPVPCYHPSSDAASASSDAANGDRTAAAAADEVDGAARARARLLTRLLGDPHLSNRGTSKPFFTPVRDSDTIDREDDGVYAYMAEQRAYGLSDGGVPITLPPSATAAIDTATVGAESDRKQFQRPAGKLHFYNPYHGRESDAYLRYHPRDAAVAAAAGFKGVGENSGNTPPGGKPTSLPSALVVPPTAVNDFSRRLCYLSENVRVRHVRADRAYGPTFGRYMAMLLYRGESLTLVIDSHNRFLPFWDTLGANMFFKFNDERAGLSHYPEGYSYAEGSPQAGRVAQINKERTEKLGIAPLDADDEEEEIQVGHSFDRATTAYLCRTFFLKSYGYLRLNGIVTHSTSDFYNTLSFLAPYYRPVREVLARVAADPSREANARHRNFRMPQPWVAGGFLLTSYHLLREVPFDPHLPHLFDGEEVLFGMRMWTHGFTLFSPESNICFHFYTRAKAPKVWNEAPTWHEVQTKSRRRVQYLLHSHLENQSVPMVSIRGNRDYSLGATRGGSQEARELAVVLVDVDRFGTGKMRSVDQWYEFAGVDPVRHHIQGRFCGLNT